MKNLFIAATLASAGVGAAPAMAATTYTWVFTVREEAVRTPVENMTINFTLEDGRSGDRSVISCTTNIEGNCSIEGTVSGGGFFSHSIANGTFNINKPGYSKNFKVSGWQINSTTKAIEVIVKPSPAPIKFEFVDSTGAPLRDVTVFYEETSKPEAVVLCSTDSSGACTFSPSEEINGQITAEKEGFYRSAVIWRQSAKPMILRNRYSQYQVQDAAGAATLRCKTKDSCDRIYSTAQIFMSRHVDMKVQFSNDTITETHNPTEPTQISGRVTRAPSGKQGWEVSLELYCGKTKDALDAKLWEKAVADHVEFTCTEKRLAAYREYRPWVQARAQ